MKCRDMQVMAREWISSTLMDSTTKDATAKRICQDEKEIIVGKTRGGAGRMIYEQVPEYAGYF